MDFPLEYSSKTLLTGIYFILHEKIRAGVKWRRPIPLNVVTGSESWFLLSREPWTTIYKTNTVNVITSALETE